MLHSRHRSPPPGTVPPADPDVCKAPGVASSPESRRGSFVAAPAYIASFLLYNFSHDVRCSPPAGAKDRQTDRQTGALQARCYFHQRLHGHTTSTPRGKVTHTVCTEPGHRFALSTRLSTSFCGDLDVNVHTAPAVRVPRWLPCCPAPLHAIVNIYNRK